MFGPCSCRRHALDRGAPIGTSISPPAVSCQPANARPTRSGRPQRCTSVDPVPWSRRRPARQRHRAIEAGAAVEDEERDPDDARAALRTTLRPTIRSFEGDGRQNHDQQRLHGADRRRHAAGEAVGGGEQHGEEDGEVERAEHGRPPPPAAPGQHPGHGDERQPGGKGPQGGGEQRPAGRRNSLSDRVRGAPHHRDQHGDPRGPEPHASTSTPTCTSPSANRYEVMTSCHTTSSS